MPLYRRSQSIFVRLKRGFSTIGVISQSPRALSTCTEDVSTWSGLTPDQLEFKAVADDFATKHLLPFAAKWDATKHFPIDTLRKAAELGFGGILVAESVGESVIVFASLLALTLLA